MPEIPVLPSRCPECNGRENGRNLVVCIDGTSNQFGRNNTNVVKLFANIDLETTLPKQHAYYSSGIGTHPNSTRILKRMARAFSDKLDMAIAWNMDEIVKDAYGWLARTYQEGDQIYLFGFSRGAYQVRVLTGMIREVGLIRTPTEKQIGTAYDHYAAIRSENPKTGQSARQFKDTFSWKDLRVHFVGVWDTVSSVGFTRGDPFLSTSLFAAHACLFRHALALDELRVKFIPEYFREMNSQTDDEKFTSNLGSDNFVDPAGDNPNLASGSGNGTNKRRTSNLKEVWFAGSHSDVGGRNVPGKSHQAGNVSLLWMRREASASGLVLQPTDIVWVPDDLDFGISNSMTSPYRFTEYIPTKHQVSFSGSGKDATRWHLFKPRRIIPGQKIHASILYANMYKPQASIGEGFDLPIPISRVGIDTELNNQIWETALFDDTTAEVLLGYLHKQGVAPIYFDRLLFMLRFEEGRKSVRKVQNWKEQLMSIAHNPHCAPLSRLVIIVAYYEASCDPKAPRLASPNIDLPQSIFDDAKICLTAILAAHKHRDCHRVVALLRPLTNHKILREKFLTPHVLETLVALFDALISRKGGNFGQAMDGLDSLLQCKDTQKTIIKTLGDNYPCSDNSRLSQILQVKDPNLLTAALRMVMTLARIPEARNVCSGVKAKIRQLARWDERLVGPLAVAILFTLYDQNEREEHLNFRAALVRANLANALVRLDPGDSADPEQQIFCQLFGLGASELNEMQRQRIGELQRAVQKGTARERTAATMTLLKLCKTEIIRTHLLQVKLLNDFVDQLRRKDTALLAAYALAACLEFSDMKDSVRDCNGLPKHIVGMLRLDYFDDAVDQTEGFQIFGSFMKHAFLREKIKNYNITEFLSTKLAKGRSQETRTSLICLDIFQFFDHDGPWARELVDQSLKSLQTPKWKSQKAGVTILSALAQTESGVKAIGLRIHEIIEMLLPWGYLVTTRGASPPSSSPGETQPVVTTTGSADPRTPTSDAPPRPPSWMMGPACALRILAQNKKLRDRTRATAQYYSLKHLFLCGTLVDETDTALWRVRTPNRTDIIDMLDSVINAVDEEMSEGLMSIGDTVLPDIRHLHSIVKMVAFPPALPGVSALAGLSLQSVKRSVPGKFMRPLSRSTTDDFIPTTNDIIESCPQFRILVIGDSGVGKSSLIKEMFGVDEHVGNDKPAEAIIDTEFVSSQNGRFVVHDSCGFEEGDAYNVEIVRDFVARHKHQPRIKDRLHVVWLCLEIPYSGGRLLGSGVENVLRNRQKLGDVPLVVVLTKVDLLDNQVEFDMLQDDLDGKTFEQHKSEFLEERCIKPLRAVAGDVPHVVVSIKYPAMLADVIEITTDLVKTNMGEDAAVIATLAQRANIKFNIESSIAIGKKKYWSILAKTMVYSGTSLKECVQVLHRDIIAVWNFYDPDEILQQDDFVGSLLHTEDIEQPNSPPIDVSSVLTARDIFRSSPEPHLLAAASIVGAAIWLANLAREKPRSKLVVKLFMLYTVGAIFVMQVVFLLAPDGRVTHEVVDRAIYYYVRSIRHRVCAQIDAFVHGPLRGRDAVLNEVEAMINLYSIKDNEVEELREIMMVDHRE